jgi:hypothetical protein
MKKTFTLVDCGRDEYPGDGLRLRDEKGKLYEKDFMQAMGIESNIGDAVEITVRLVSRMETRRVPVCNICNRPDCDTPNGKH